MSNDLTTNFVGRLRAREPEAWFELWENFGPVLRSQLARWGRGHIGVETVQDLSQETLAALSGAIDTHDPNKGARFSTWLLAIARHTLGDEIDRRMAQKRGSGVKPISLEDAGDRPGSAEGPDGEYEREVFEAKIAAALRGAERDAGFADFNIYRMRVLESCSGKEVAISLGMSEATVSRRLTAVRTSIRDRLFEVFSKYSFTDDEWEELTRNGLDLNPTKKDEASFDDALGDIYHRFSRSGASQGPPSESAGGRQFRHTSYGSGV